MVKRSRFPAFSRMTGGAVCAKASVVCIIREMAGRTVWRRVLEIFDGTGIQMTFRANDLRMLAGERKIGLGVVVKVRAVAF